MKESDLWKLIRDCPKNVNALMERIETSTALGVPDLYFCIEGVSTWTELKALEETPTGKYNLSLRKYPLHQRSWLKAHWRAGGTSLLCVGIGRKIYWCEPPYALTIVKFTEDEIKRRAIATGPQLPF